ncbi:MAG: hypothetical protein AAF639_20425 [Chloroflexota bacterium]
MMSEAQTFDNIIESIKQLSLQYRLRLMEELMRTLWEILPVKSETQPAQSEWPPNFFEETAGSWQGEPLVRDDQGDYEVRLELL